MWNLIEFQYGNIKGREQPHISYHILSLHDMDVTLKRKSMGNTTMKYVNWLAGVGDVNEGFYSRWELQTTLQTAQILTS